MTVPWIKTLEADVDNIAATSDEYTIVGRAPFAATVTAVTYIPRDTVTGLTSATASRFLRLYNRLAASGGTVLVAEKHIASGSTHLTDNVATELTLQTAANLVVASGDVLELESLHITTGVLDPGGRIIVTLSRT